MYDENLQFRENCSVISNYPIAQSTPIKRSNSYLPQNTIDKIPSCSSISKRRPVIIKLPSYIINSHPVSKKPNQDVAQKYNIHLISPENERLYISNHHVLLQVMTQYVYYRKLCVWIKEELRKKRLELLDIARNALITARDSHMCSLENMSDSELTVEEKHSLLKYAKAAAMDEFNDACHNEKHSASGSCHRNSKDNNRPKISQEKCHKFDLTAAGSHSNEEQNIRSDQCYKGKNQTPSLNSQSDFDCEFCPSNLEKFARHRNKIEPACFDELYMCEKCGSSKKLVKGKLKLDTVDKAVEPETTCVKADSCTCHTEKKEKDKKKSKCCVIM